MIKKKNLSNEDKKSWEDFINNPLDIYDKERKNIKTQSINHRFKFDLHGLTLEEANNKVREIIFDCVENKYNEILLITGKGIHSKNENDVYVSNDLGKLKFSVPEFINSNEELNKFIISVRQARKEDGGEGAIIVKLKNKL